MRTVVHDHLMEANMKTTVTQLMLTAALTCALPWLAQAGEIIDETRDVSADEVIDMELFNGDIFIRG
jgi:hypothetical protein